MSRTLHPQYRDDNSASRYPFTDFSTMRAVTGAQLDPRLFIDAAVYPVGVAAALCIRSITVAGLLLTITVGTATADAATGTVDLEALEDDGVVPLVDSLNRPAGVLLADPALLAGLQSWPQGLNALGINAAQFVASCVVASPELGVRGLAAGGAEPLAGDVWLVGENGIVLTRTEADEVRVDVVGEPLFKRLLCESTAGFNPPKFLKTINSIPPTYWGGWRLRVGRGETLKPALRIYADGDTLVVGLASK